MKKYNRRTAPLHSEMKNLVAVPETENLYRDMFGLRGKEIATSSNVEPQRNDSFKNFAHTSRKLLGILQFGDCV
jgi:hypothetical protein